MNGTRGRASCTLSLLSLDLVDSLSLFEPVVIVVIVRQQSRVVANRAVDSVAHSLRRND